MTWRTRQRRIIGRGDERRAWAGIFVLLLGLLAAGVWIIVDPQGFEWRGSTLSELEAEVVGVMFVLLTSGFLLAGAVTCRRSRRSPESRSGPVLYIVSRSRQQAHIGRERTDRSTSRR